MQHTRLKLLEHEITSIEDELTELERQGVFGGLEYDALLEEIVSLEGDIADIHRYGDDNE